MEQDSRQFDNKNNVVLSSYVYSLHVSVFFLLYCNITPSTNLVFNVHLLLLFFSHPIYYPRSTLALPPSSNSDPGPHSGPPPPTPPLHGTCLHFYHEKSSALSSFGDSRRIVLLWSGKILACFEYSYLYPIYSMWLVGWCSIPFGKGYSVPPL